ncbi:MAG: hypothetical protein KF745_08565 [Phycisphaeraceae bacterium]|nr:hypothetical protein [Phycisphaeraceae bacterium]
MAPDPTNSAARSRWPVFGAAACLGLGVFLGCESRHLAVPESAVPGDARPRVLIRNIADKQVVYGLAEWRGSGLVVKATRLSPGQSRWLAYSVGDDLLVWSVAENPREARRYRLGDDTAKTTENIDSLIEVTVVEPGVQ